MFMLKNKTGMTLMEVLIAVVIFAITLGGFLFVLNVATVPSSNQAQRLGAAQYGKQVLEQLRQKVDSDYWDSFTGGSVTNGIYTATYTVTDDVATGAKNIQMRVTY